MAGTAQPRIVLVGAGSTVFAKNLMGDLLSYPELANANLVLFDIDASRLDTSTRVAHKLANTLGASPTIESTLDRGRALDGANYVISMFQVGGYRPATVTDFEIPKRYGLRQTIGDTLGIGGIMRGLRTIPVFLDLLRDMEQRCPDALHLNYVNPMVMNCWAMNRATRIKTVGLCHSVQHTAADLARDIGVPIEDIDYLCAGINHMAFYLKFERGGEDLYPRLLEVAASGAIPYRGDADRADGGDRGLSDAVRYAVLETLGYFVTESSEHFSEYVPWFIKRDRDDLLARYEIPLDEYLRRCEVQLAGWERQRQAFEDPATAVTVQRSDEYGATIVHAHVTDTPATIYGNVSNNGLIDNLPSGAIVEVPCRVDGSGVTPQPIGTLPPHLAALMQTNLNVHAVTVEAVLAERREHVYHAALLDPLTAATLSVTEIRSLVDELIVAHGDYIPATLRRSTSSVRANSTA
ncbi:MAG: alpha-glucosidase/alpha-galactosidase [Pseudomonadota bacterium]